MGWDFTQGATRKEIIAKRIEAWEGTNGSRSTCLRHTTRGNVLWTVWEVTYSYGKVNRVIGCDLLRKHGNFGWGYKSMTESWGPCYYTCPLAYLDMVPVANEEWREKVREYHAKRKRKFELGETVRLVGSTIPYVIVTSTRPLYGFYAGKTYRIPRKMIA